ncbi:MAG TPA: TIGR03667 family PPOX class F420-dependent oxidoreductase [Candidatus Dormibacteraeota bacterium]|nr:TIGR03667 family PPOX class F420-dependent oxidoreductase [Candidatus Dormibacteraeota bacterium]
MGPLIDTTTEFGARAARRLQEDTVGWLVTVSSDGTPQPNPVWFSWDGESILVYSEPGQAKLRNVEANPRVALHLDSRSSGDDIVIVIADAAIDRTAPPVHQNDAYATKYDSEMARLGLGPPDKMAETYSVAIRLVPTKVRGF